MKQIFNIENREIGIGQKPFLIAEMSGNHNQSIDRALEIVEAASKAGADAIKLQTYTADTMTIKGAYTISDENSLWNGKELHDLYKEAYTPWEWHKEIFAHARKFGLIPFSSPFDNSAVDFLEDLNVGVYKIASFENTDIPLIKKIASTGKPVIMSTGAASLAQIDEAVSAIRDAGCDKLVLLKCTSSYPSSPENTNLKTLPQLENIFKCPVGLSDHTMGIGAAIASVGLGASVIEKHFTLKRSDGGVDSLFSLEPKELESLSREMNTAYLALGEIKFGLSNEEYKTVEFKRSIYVSKSIKSGEKFTSNNIRIVRPGLGLAPKYLNVILTRKATQDIESGQPLTWKNL